MLMVDRYGTPLSAFTVAANEAEVNAIETLVDVRVPTKKPRRLTYDKAGDADWLREAFRNHAKIRSDSLDITNWP